MPRGEDAFLPGVSRASSRLQPRLILSRVLAGSWRHALHISAKLGYSLPTWSAEGFPLRGTFLVRAPATSSPARMRELKADTLTPHAWHIALTLGYSLPRWSAQRNFSPAGVSRAAARLHPARLLAS